MRLRPIAMAGLALWVGAAGCQLFSGIDDLEIVSCTGQLLGPLVAGGCTEGKGTPCETYCCQDAVQGCGQYPDDVACRAVCETWQASGTYPTNTETEGGYGCRSGATGAGNCIAMGPAGRTANDENSCGSECANFCALQERTCGFGDSCGLAPAYANLTECLDVCEGYSKIDPYEDDVTSGDSYRCRLNWLVRAAAAQTAELHASYCESSSLGSVPCD